MGWCGLTHDAPDFAAGDYGFDPLRIGGNAELLPYYREAELMNGRWAMAAVAGILFTDAFGLGNWWEAGTKEYALPTPTLIAIEVAVMAVLEAKRIEGFQKTGETGFLGSYPFDPMGMASDEKKVKELKNARLAMLAFLGFSSQAAVTGMGPIECLKAHIEDPWHNNSKHPPPSSCAPVTPPCVRAAEVFCSFFADSC